MRVVFMGTPDFAVGTLEALLEAGHEVVAVVTQPDKPKGRGKTLMPTPVKEAALARMIPVLQPKKVREPEFVETLRKIGPDVIVVAAFGQIISKEILEMPRYGCINVHASLLPAYRGAAPIQWAVINGDKESGVTIMRMNEGLDTGDMIDKVVVPLDENETGGSLFDKLSAAGAKLCAEVLEKLENGTAVFEKQPELSTTDYAAMIDKKMGKINWERPAKEIEQLIRGLNPWPSAYTFMKGKSLKLWTASVVYEEREAVPGEIVEIGKEGILVKTGEGLLLIRELQLEGKKRMDTAAFLRGYT
ncbi:methionyl-tRNA formyltransferase, partial [Blautia producta]